MLSCLPTIISNKGKVIIFTISVYMVIYILLCHFPMIHRIITIQSNPQFQDEGKYLINTKGCRIPKFHPFDPSVSIYFEEYKSPVSRCHDTSFLRVDKNKIYLNAEQTKKKFKKLSCFYEPIIRDPNNSTKWADYKVAFGKSKRLKFGQPLTDEFVKVECFDYNNNTAFVDYLALMLLKPAVEKRCDAASKEMLGSDPLNIIMIAVDSTSKLNFLRHFPLTRGFLKTTLKPFEFHGHNKVADNTFVNMVPMLTGHFVSYYRKDEEVRNTYYDDIDLVWKEYSTSGYRTFFIEDTPNAGTFTYLKKGFKKRATDYYLRPFAIKVEATKWRTRNGAYCYGHTSETEFFYGYFREFVRRMGKRPYFAFTFISRPTHDYLNTAGYVDKPTFELFKDLMDSNVFNNSALFFFSDHGLRFGKVRETFIGKIEERMPFMFQYYPEWFLKKHEDIRRALTINQRRLTTPFEVHRTLQDILDFSSKYKLGIFEKRNRGYGQSLFEEISPERTCNDSQIIPHWCSCHNHIKLYNTDDKVIKLADGLIDSINKFISNSKSNHLCAPLKIKKIVDAYASAPESTSAQSSSAMEDYYYLLTVEAAPSEAIFEGTLRFDHGKIQTVGEISRINSYGNQSSCIQEHVLKKYCFCRNLTTKLPNNVKNTKKV